MSDFSGMDIAQIRALATQMGNDADEIESTLQRLTASLESTAWRGPDQQRFVDEWRTQHAAALLRVADGLHAAAKEANESARQQEWASRA